MKKPGDTVIHLDAYSEPDSSDSITIRNKKFDSYLDKNFSNWRQMSNATENGENGTLKRYSEEYWDMVDDFRLAIEEYGKQEYYDGHRVIVEGVQIADDWLSPDKSYYKDKPIVILNTTAVSSMRRASERDRGNATKSLTDVGTESEKEYAQWYIDTKDRLNDLVVQTGAKRDEEYVKSILKEICDAWQ